MDTGHLHHRVTCRFRQLDSLQSTGHDLLRRAGSLDDLRVVDHTPAKNFETSCLVALRPAGERKEYIPHECSLHFD